MSEDRIVSFSLELNVEPSLVRLRKYQTVLYRTLGLIERLGLNEKLSEQVRQIQQQIAFLNKLRLAYLAVQAARMAAGDPLAWGMAFVAVGEVAMDVSDVFGSQG